MGMLLLDINVKTVESKELIDTDRFIHSMSDQYEYHTQHISMARDYALEINNRLGNPIDSYKMEYAALAHDLMKEKSSNKSEEYLSNSKYNIPADIHRYVRLNLNVLEKFGLDEYFNTDVQLHPLAAGIFLNKEFGVKDREILYAVMFHSCPIMPVYNDLTEHEKTIVNIMMLSDKLSSNSLRINMQDVAVRVDLDKIVFGEDGREFNYKTGLFISRLIGQGGSKEKQSKATTKYFLNELQKTNPLIPHKCSLKQLGGIKHWPKRKSQALKHQ